MVAARPTGGDEYEVERWSFASSALADGPSLEDVRTVAYLPRSRLFAAASRRGAVALWGVTEPRARGEALKPTAGVIGDTRIVTLGEDGQRMLIACDGGRDMPITVTDVEANELVRLLPATRVNEL